MMNTGSFGFMVVRGAVLAACGLAGCGGNGGGGMPAPVVLDSVAESPSMTTMTSGATTQLKAVGTYSDGHTADITAMASWTVDQSSCASVVATTGLVTAILGAGSCGATVTATYDAAMGTAAVSVQGLYATAVALPNLSVYRPNGAAIGDFNGDGIPDVATTSLSGNIQVSLGTGGGAFAASQLVLIAGGGKSSSPAVGDFNGDGIDDVVVVTSPGLALLLGSSSGSFAAPTSFAAQLTAISSVAVGDFNGDGKLDLAAATSTGNGVSVLLGDGMGGFGAPSSISLGLSPDFVAVADVNGDGKADLVVADYVAGQFAVLIGDGTGSFGAPIVTSIGGHANPGLLGNVRLALGDFNSDGHLDIAVANGTTSVSIFLGDGTGSFKPAGEIAVGVSVVSVATGDFNGDGNLDIVALGSQDPAANAPLRMAFGTGTGMFGTPIQLDFSVGSGEPISVVAGDVSRTGKLDLLLPDIGSIGPVWMLLHQ